MQLSYVYIQLPGKHRRRFFVDTSKFSGGKKFFQNQKNFIKLRFKMCALFTLKEIFRYYVY